MSRDFCVFSELTVEATDSDGKARFDKDFWPANIGTQSQVKERISEALPSVEWQGEFFGVLETTVGSFEVDLRRNEKISNFIISSRGDVSFEILLLKQKTGWKFIDTATDGWVHSKEDLSLGATQFQSFLESSIGHDVDP